MRGATIDRDLLDSVHDEASLVAASRWLFYKSRLSTDLLRARLDDENPHMRWVAAMTLVRNGIVPSVPELIVPVLVEAIKLGGPDVRTLAFERLDSLTSYQGRFSTICDPVVDEAIVAAMRDPESSVRRGATNALGRCLSLPVAIAAREIADTNGLGYEARSALIWNLSLRGAEAKLAAPALIAALDDRMPSVRNDAAKTLRSAGVDPDTYVPAILDELIRRRDDPYSRALGKLIAVAPAAGRWTPDIIRILRDEPNEGARRQLRIALNVIGTPEAKRAAAISAGLDAIAAAAPWVLSAACLVAMVVSAVKRGWGQPLGFASSGIAVAAAAFGDRVLGEQWTWAVLGGPPLALAGVVAAVGFASRAASSGRRALGLVVLFLNGLALLFCLLLAIAIFSGLGGYGGV